MYSTMTPCACAGLEPSWRCQWYCQHCYYVRNPKLHTNEEQTIEALMHQVDDAKARGCNQICLVGQGEPTLYPKVLDLIKYATSVGVCSSMITNGAAGPKRYEQLYAAGLDHLLISMHGTGAILDEIAVNKTAAIQQTKLLEWLKETKLPFRTNCTVQKANYQHLAEILQASIDYGSLHCVILGFLPHYDWKDHLEETAVATNVSAPFVEKAAEVVLAAGRMLTMRYQPHCLINPKYWPYIVNARYVPFDPWEWDNGHHDYNAEKVWQFAVGLGEQVAVKGQPCEGCAVKLHCGGYNKVFTDVYGKGLLHALTEADIPAELREAAKVRGGLHVQNPANLHYGVFRPESVARVEAILANRASQKGNRDVRLPIL